jgi:hypothetical protein
MDSAKEITSHMADALTWMAEHFRDCGIPIISCAYAKQAQIAQAIDDEIEDKEEK